MNLLVNITVERPFINISRDDAPPGLNKFLVMFWSASSGDRWLDVLQFWIIEDARENAECMHVGLVLFVCEPNGLRKLRHQVGSAGGLEPS